MKRLVLLIFFLFFLLPQKAFGSFNFYISDISPSTASSGDQEITAHLKITDLPSESYFRVALQKPTGGSYFGFIQNNNGEWVKIQSLSSDQCVFYYHITDLSTSDLTLKFKIGDDNTIDQSSYKLKAHRFTKTCTSYTEATNSADMVLNFPTPTSTNTPSATPNYTVTKTPTPSSTIAPSPKVTLKAVKSASVGGIKNDSTLSGTILISSGPTKNEKLTVAGDFESNKKRLFVIIVLSAGLVLVIIAGAVLIKKYSREIIEWLNT